uniref:Sodium/potassium/calcium exchanger 6, mitochondrial n=1 Tax=Hadrurus spadix TaxID=141984 RepID=A0A1W7RA41_9SCOR
MENNVTLYLQSCKHVHHLESHSRCHFVKKVEDCLPTSGGLDYVKFTYCSLGEDGTPWAISLTLMWLGLLFVALGVTADDFLCPALVVITKTLGLSDNIAGITFLSLGNGAPDIFTSVIGVLQGRAPMIIGQLFGGGVFVTTVVAGSICIYKSFNLMQRPFLRDTIFYIVAIYWVFCVCYYGKINLVHSIGFILFYGIYILTVIIGRYLNKKYCKKYPSSQYGSTDTVLRDSDGQSDDRVASTDNGDALIEGLMLRRSFTANRCNILRSTEGLDQTAQLDGVKEKGQVSEEDEKRGICKEFLYHICPLNLATWHESGCFWRSFEVIKIPTYLLLKLTVPVVDCENFKNNWCRILNTTHCVTGPLLMAFVTRRATALVGDLFPVWAIILIFSIVVAVAVYFTTENDRAPAYHWAFGYFGFLVSVFWIYALTKEITIILRAIGIVFNISDVILGLTLMAWGNSIGDLITNISVARQGFPRMGFSACYGSPLSTLLLGLGIAFTIHIIHNNTSSIEIQRNFLMTLLYGVLSFILVSTLVAMMILKFETKRWYGIYLLIIYGMFLGFAILVEIGVLA